MNTSQSTSPVSHTLNRDTPHRHTPHRSAWTNDAAPQHERTAADSPANSRYRFGAELDAAVAAWATWIGRRRNRAIWSTWVDTYPALAGVDPSGAAETRIDITTQADAIHDLMRIARSEPVAVTALLALLAPVWMYAKRKYVSLETAELASAILSENLDVDSCRRAPVRAIVRKATRQSDRSYWVPNGDKPGRNELRPLLEVRPATGDFVETLVTTAVIEQLVEPGSCLHLRITGHTPAQINALIGSPKKARTRTFKERVALAEELELSTGSRPLIIAA